MKKLTKRIAVTVSSVAVATVAVLGTGSAASAVPLASTHGQSPAIRAEATDDGWDHGVGYLLEQGYSCDETRGWHQDPRATDSTRHDCDGLFYRDGHFYRGESDGHRWTSDTSYQHEGPTTSTTAGTGTTTA